MNNERDVQDAIEYYEIDPKVGKYLKDNDKISIVNDGSDFFDVLKKYTNDEYYFRGISCPSQKYSGITRKYFDNFNTDYQLDGQQELEYFNEELQIIRKFEQKASFLCDRTPSTLDLVAMAQHYSIKTRLIDWTTSPIIATLFSLYKPQKNEKFKYYLVLVARKKDHITVYDLQTTNSLRYNSPNYIVYEDMLRNLMSIYFTRKATTEPNEIEAMFEDIFYRTNTIRYLYELEKEKTESNFKRSDEYFRRIKELPAIMQLPVSNIVLSLVEAINPIAHKLKKAQVDAIFGTPKIDNIITNNVNKFKANRSLFIETCSSNVRMANQRGLFQIAILPNKKYMDDQFYMYDLILINAEKRSEILNLCDNLGIGLYGLMPDRQSIANIINDNLDI